MRRRNGMINTLHIYDSGKVDPWEMKYIDLAELSLIVKESEDDNIVRSTIHLYEIVEILRDDTNTTITEDSLEKENRVEILDDSENKDVIRLEKTNKIIIHIKTRFRSEWKFEMDSEEMYDEWDSIMQRHKGIMREEDINPRPTPSQRFKKEKYSFRTFYENRKLFGGLWMIYAFILYTIICVVLFSVLWTQYVLPEKNIVEIKTSCFIISEYAEYLWKRNYNLNIEVSYLTEEGETLTNLMVQFCSGKQCPDFMEDNYPVRTTQTCWYDEANPNYVFFDLSQMVRKRYTIVAGICGGITAPWVIFVFVMFLVQGKKIFEMVKNSCCCCCLVDDDDDC